MSFFQDLTDSDMGVLSDGMGLTQDSNTNNGGSSSKKVMTEYEIDKEMGILDMLIRMKHDKREKKTDEVTVEYILKRLKATKRYRGEPPKNHVCNMLRCKPKNIDTIDDPSSGPPSLPESEMAVMNPDIFVCEYGSVHDCSESACQGNPFVEGGSDSSYRGCSISGKRKIVLSSLWISKEDGVQVKDNRDEWSSAKKSLPDTSQTTLDSSGKKRKAKRGQQKTIEGDAPKEVELKRKRKRPNKKKKTKKNKMKKNGENNVGGGGGRSGSKKGSKKTTGKSNKRKNNGGKNGNNRRSKNKKKKNRRDDWEWFEVMTMKRELSMYGNLYSETLYGFALSVTWEQVWVANGNLSVHQFLRNRFGDSPSEYQIEILELVDKSEKIMRRILPGFERLEVEEPFIRNEMCVRYSQMINKIKQNVEKKIALNALWILDKMSFDCSNYCQILGNWPTLEERVLCVRIILFTWLLCRMANKDIENCKWKFLDMSSHIIAVLYMMRKLVKSHDVSILSMHKPREFYDLIPPVPKFADPGYMADQNRLTFYYKKEEEDTVERKKVNVGMHIFSSCIFNLIGKGFPFHTLCPKTSPYFL